MIWVAWRQHRGEYLLTAAALAALAVFLLPTGMALAQDAQQMGVTGCMAQNAADCGNLALSFATQSQGFNEIAGFFPLLPLLPGLLIGAPLVAREVRQRTYVLVWTQSITRALAERESGAGTAHRAAGIDDNPAAADLVV